MTQAGAVELIEDELLDGFGTQAGQQRLFEDALAGAGFARDQAQAALPGVDAQDVEDFLVEIRRCALWFNFDQYFAVECAGKRACTYCWQDSNTERSRSGVLKENWRRAKDEQEKQHSAFFQLSTSIYTIQPCPFGQSKSLGKVTVRMPELSGWKVRFGV